MRLPERWHEAKKWNCAILGSSRSRCARRESDATQRRQRRTCRFPSGQWSNSSLERNCELRSSSCRRLHHRLKLQSSQPERLRPERGPPSCKCREEARDSALFYMERLPGFRDFYPEPVPQPDLWSADARQYIFEQWRGTARRYGFREYDGPPLEPLELFTTKSGAEIVDQLYNFKDKGEREVSLRPEMTPTLARMAAAAERNYKKPIKWFALPQLFRYERQQKGRLREHFQFNADIVGEADPAADAELIALLIDSLRSFGLTAEDFVIRLSSRNAWQDFFAGRRGDPAKASEFYQAIDKLERETPEQNQQKLSAFGFSIAEV